MSELLPPTQEMLDALAASQRATKAAVERVTGKPVSDVEMAELARAILDAPLTKDEEADLATMFGQDPASRRYIRARENNRAVFGGAAE